MDPYAGRAGHRITVLQEGPSRTVRRQWMPARMHALLGGDPATELCAQRKAAWVGLAPDVMQVNYAGRWIDMEWVPGHHLPHDWLQQARYARQFLDVLGRLQQIPCDDLPAISLLERCAHLHARLTELDAARARLHAESIRTLHERVNGLQPSRGEAVLVHGDLHATNVIVRTKPSDPWCLLDWEYAHQGHALEDLAGVLVEQPAEFAALWQGRGELAAVLRESGWTVSLSALEFDCEIRRVLNAVWRDLFAALQKDPLMLE